MERYASTNDDERFYWRTSQVVVPADSDQNYLESELIELDICGDTLLVIGEELDSQELDFHGPTRTYLVCSEILARVSSTFAHIFADSSRHSSRSQPVRPAGSWNVFHISQDDALAFDYFARIAHGRFNDIPETLSIDQLYELTMLTHRYNATCILAPWIERWMATVSCPSPEYGLSMYKLLAASYELGCKRTFETTTRRILMELPSTYSGQHIGYLPKDLIG